MSITDTMLPQMVAVIAVLAVSVLLSAAALRRRGGRVAGAARVCGVIANVSLAAEALALGWAFYAMSSPSEPSEKATHQARALSFGLNAAATEVALLSVLLATIAGLAAATRRRY